MAEDRPRSLFVPVAVVLLVAVLTGGNAYLGTRLYEEQRRAANIAAVTPKAPTVADLITSRENLFAPSLKDFRVVNAHDHLYRIQDFERYLPAADALGIAKTIFVASSEYTIKGKGGDKEKDNDVNSKEVLACAAKYPDKVVPFVTLTPKTPDKVALLQGYVAQGAKGLKLYTGHSDFHDVPLDDPEMLPVYAWAEQEQFPIVWHVNLNNFQDELTRVLLKYPKLRVMIPHFGVGFFDTQGKILDRLGEILDTYPNVYVDTSFGTREILVSGMERVSMVPDVFKRFYEKHQDRILFGTDMVVTGNKEKTTEWISSVIRACRDMHEKPEYVFWMAAKGGAYADKNTNNIYGRLRGLALPPEILKKIYETNAEKFLAKQ